MLYFILGFLGLYVGLLLSYISPEEMKMGEKWFKGLILLSLLSLIIISFHNFVWWLLFIGLFLGLIFSYDYLYLGIGVVSSLNFVLYSCLIFVFGLGYGSYFRKKKWFLVNILLFFIPFLLILVDFNFISLSAGGLIGCFIKRVYKK